MGDAEVGLATKRLSKGCRRFVELEVLEQGDAEVVRAVGLFLRRADGRCLADAGDTHQQESGSDRRARSAVRHEVVLRALVVAGTRKRIPTLSESNSMSCVQYGLKRR